MSRVFVETIAPPVPLVLFGAGHDALPVVEMARGMGWRTEVVDLQSRPASRARFARADKVTLARPETVGEQVRITPRTLALVMTHNYEHDRYVVAEMCAVLEGRRGGMLRERRGPIHGGAGGGERVPLNGEQTATLAA